MHKNVTFSSESNSKTGSQLELGLLAWRGVTVGWLSTLDWDQGVAWAPDGTSATGHCLGTRPPQRTGSRAVLQLVISSNTAVSVLQIIIIYCFIQDECRCWSSIISFVIVMLEQTWWWPVFYQRSLSAKMMSHHQPTWGHPRHDRLSAEQGPDGSVGRE